MSPTAPPSATATTKLLPPVAPASLLGRDRLFARLDEALERRLTIVVADAGFGKSTLLSAWAAGVNCAWYSASPEDESLAIFARGIVDALRLRVPPMPTEIAGAVVSAAGPDAEADDRARAQGVAALVCEALQAQLRRDLVLVVDDVHELSGSPGAMQLIESLCRQAPTRLHVVLARASSRRSRSSGCAARARCWSSAGADLAFDVEETAELLGALTGDDDAQTAAELHRATGGWPAAVRLAVETLRGVRPLAAGRRSTGFAGPVGRSSPISPPRSSSTSRPASRSSSASWRRSSASRRSCARRSGSIDPAGRSTRSRGAASSSSSTASRRAGTRSVRPCASSRSLSSGADEARDLQMRAARWFEENGHLEEALRCLAEAGDSTELGRLLARARRGAARRRRRRRRAQRGRARARERARRDDRAARRRGVRSAATGRGRCACFARAAAGDAATLHAGIAWRMGLIHHFRGELDEADADLRPRSRRGRRHRATRRCCSPRTPPSHWLRGDAETCRARVEPRARAGSAIGDPQALAAAHTVLAMLAALEGDRRQRHSLPQALDARGAGRRRAADHPHLGQSRLALPRRGLLRATRSPSSSRRWRSPTSPASPLCGRWR